MTDSVDKTGELIHITLRHWLRDMIRHMEWADAEHWKALEKFPGGLNDLTIQKHLHHIHLVQHAFCSVVSEKAPTWKKQEDFRTAAGLKSWAKEQHANLEVFLKNATDSTLSYKVTVPWFKNPPLKITIAEALTQVTMHSHYHRAQNALRFRDIGGDPPLTDIIAWYWKGRPKAEW